jgi:hypothetical protein
MSQPCRSCESKRILRGAVVVRGSFAWPNRNPVLQGKSEHDVGQVWRCAHRAEGGDLGGLRAVYGSMSGF